MEWRWSDHYARVHLENMGYIVKKAELTDDWGGLMKKKSKSKGGAAMFDYFQLERPNGSACFWSIQVNRPLPGALGPAWLQLP